MLNVGKASIRMIRMNSTKGSKKDLFTFILAILNSTMVARTTSVHYSNYNRESTLVNRVATYYRLIEVHALKQFIRQLSFLRRNKK